MFIRSIVLVGLALIAAFALAQSTNIIAPNPNYTITSFPLYGATVTPHDTTPLASPGMIRPNADGAVRAVCVGNALAAPVTLTLVAGEFFPCVVSYVLDTGTDAITIHVFY